MRWAPTEGTVAVRVDGAANMALLGLDIGTTSCKAAVFDLDGAMLSLATKPTPLGRDREGHPSYDPQALWETASGCIREAAHEASPAIIDAVGVASMAEAGLLVEGRSGEPRTP